MKNPPARKVRNRTYRPNSPETSDRRVRRTKHSLHSALIGLAHEKPYESIAVKEILSRADVGRSTFYTHFAHKDELLESGIHELLGEWHRRDSPDILGFSLPFLQHIEEHRQNHGPQLARHSRVALHDHLQSVLAGLVAQAIQATRASAQTEAHVSTELLGRHVAATFVLVLNWWLESEPALTPTDVDARFRRLILPAFANV